MRLPIFLNDKSCKSCDLHQIAKSVCVPVTWMEGSLPPDEGVRPLVFLGQNPGQKEDEANEPFIGPSGMMVRQVYTTVPYPPNVRDTPEMILRKKPLTQKVSIYLANAAKCYHGPSDSPTPKQYKTCMDRYFIDDMLQIWNVHKTEIILITLGAHSARHFYKKFTKTSVSLSKAMVKVGHKMLVDSMSVPTAGGLFVKDTSWDGHIPLCVFSTFHPAYILRDKGSNQLFAVRDHMQMVHDYLDGMVAVPSKPKFVPTRAPRI